MSPETDRVSLKTAIAALRRQLKEAAEEAKGLKPDEVKFRISEINLELTVVAEDTTTAGGEIGWWIFKAKADVAAKDAVTHKINLRLNVGDIEVGSEQDTQ